MKAFDPRRTVLRAPLKSNHAALGSHLGEGHPIRELRSQERKVCLGHPTGDCARASHVHGYLEVPNLLRKFSEWGEPHTVHGIDHPWLSQDGRLPQ
jgi:hypothetical protein